MTVRVLAIASSGGHWTQLMRLRGSWEGCDVAYATSDPSYREIVIASGNSPDSAQSRFYSFPDANRWQKFRLILQLLKISAIVVRERPAVVVSTGASCGYFALRIGKLLGARTVWVDSIANSEEISMAGRKAARYADLWMTQWPHLSEFRNANGRQPLYRGSVL